MNKSFYAFSLFKAASVGLKVSDSKKPQNIVVEAFDSSSNLKSLLTYIAFNGNGGHSFEIVVDPKSDNEKTFFWDGDGSDRIFSVKVDGETVKYEEFE